MEVLDLFSAAAGGWSIGMHRAGFTTVAACEVEAWRRAVYAENNPHVRLYDDVRTLTADRLRDDLGRLPTVIVGSPPCQDISSANTKGKGVEGERSGLYFEAIRIIGECRPRWFALENSANLRTRGADAVLAALEALDYACWPFVVRAGDVGANHERPRAWLIGCDLAQVADPDGERWDEGWRGRRLGLDVPAAADISDPSQDGRGSGISGRCAVATERVSEPARGDAGNTDCQSGAARIGATQSEGSDDLAARRLQSNTQHGGGGAFPNAGNPPHPDQARQAHGCGAGRSADGASAGQVGLCTPDCRDAYRSGPDWSLEHLADHLRLDDGLSAWLAGTRVQIGNGKGQSAASLAVEAFGDAVVPQIPEAIGRAILRTEQALAAVYQRSASHA